jgi:predicted HTH transcriptional regulator
MANNERIMSDFNEIEKLIIHFLQNNGIISNKQAVELTKLSPAQIRRIFANLQARNIIITKGNGRNKKYSFVY